VGRLLLAIVHERRSEILTASDALCTALQLLNFLQDIQQDLAENDRLYLPLADLAASGVSEHAIRTQQDSAAMRQLLAHQRQRIATLLQQAAPLDRLRGRLGWEIRLIHAAAWRLLHRFECEQPHNPFGRPRLGWRDLLPILWRAGRQRFAAHSHPAAIEERR
jgi:hydroxysqualene synthase